MCTLLFRQALDAASRAYDDPAQRDVVAAELFGQGVSAGPSKVDFLQSISYVADGAAQYGQTHGLCAAFLVGAADPGRQDEPHPALDLITPTGASDANEIERQLSAMLRGQTRRRR